MIVEPHVSILVNLYYAVLHGFLDKLVRKRMRSMKNQGDIDADSLVDFFKSFDKEENQ